MSRQHLTDATRAALVEAAIHEFAAHGFDAASTRAIAARAGVHQPQINYHFESKSELWRAAVDHLFDELDTELAGALGGDVDDASGFEDTIRAFVRHAARRPELNRIMVKESSIESERLAWMVERHIRHRFDAVSASWDALRAHGAVIDVDAVTAFYMLLGAGTLLYTNAPEARLLTGVDPLEPSAVDAHADAMARLLFVHEPAAAVRAHRPSRPTTRSTR